MNSILTLAKDLEQKSKAQQQTIGEMLKSAFSEHEKSVRAELSESEKRISGVQLSTCGEQRRRCVRVNPEAGRFGEDSSWIILAGK
ncbi:MbeB family mobilization protein [Kosakonia oryziphila]|uniref:MbeB-like, N-term conserved region n=1 Tax=Kosakonia oryziphila TaxID=1005667 RepID=A0A1C4G8K8_9ENTR|nr:MbeB family mobilization protein [Kosakonia oryziphila]SCC64253.1 MbeB-like, N-term conserved region [Kosakonia oryziphila]